MSQDLSALRVGVLFDSYSDNVGDVAMFEAAATQLRRLGLDQVVALDPADPGSTQVDAIIVGGGELIRAQGDAFYDHFRLPGATMLCAAGVHADADHLDYLRDYQLVSARTQAETATLSAAGIPARTVACATTLLEAQPAPVPLPTEEPLIGVHLVPTSLRQCPGIVEAINELPGRKVIIPFTRYLRDASFMSALPIGDANTIVAPADLSPAQLKWLLGQMHLNVVSSLHASIFSYSMGVPFASLAQPKVVAYLGDRGLDQWLYRDDVTLRQALAAVSHAAAGGSGPEVPDLAGLLAQDRAGIEQLFADFARALPLASPPQITKTASENRQEILTDQVEQVIQGRDVLIGTMFGRYLEAVDLRRVRGELEAQVIQRDRQLAELNVELGQLRQQLQGFRGLGVLLVGLAQKLLRRARGK